jgi:hypothetical protein
MHDGSRPRANCLPFCALFVVSRNSGSHEFIHLAVLDAILNPFP